ncbi:hypothetical protein CAEBREN_29388 [Caenorhabditis brenneri]|uniref:DNA-directed DNA polymerase n=1 Tax=Caenorhabditis brenneri TaxID=135651 RepID=G0NVL6_CAEBE|nr:hypothetical protein CAEBREN_29388 [Caenorhabditis brenneri]
MASPNEQVKLFSNEWPTAEELEFFDKFAQIDDATDLIRHTSHTLKLPPCRVVFKNLEQLPKDQPLQHHIGRIFDIFIRSTLKKAEGDFVFTKYWLNLRHPAYIEKDGFWIMHQTYQKANGHTLMNIISKHSQSKSELTLDETLVLSMRVFKTDVFPGRGGRLSDDILKMFGLKSPNVVGNSHCLAKAIVIGRYWSDMNSRENDASEQSYNAKMYKKLVRPERANTNRPRFQLEEAMSFLSEMGMDPEEKEHNIEDLAEIAEMMPNYRFCVWSGQQGTAIPTVIFEANTKASGFIPLFHAEDHFEFFLPTCTKVQVRYCFKCCEIVNKNHAKKCNAKCQRCGRQDCKPSEESKFCKDCNIWFHSIECFEAHLMKVNVSSLPFCEKYEKCQACAIIHRREQYAKNEHICHHQDFCTICKKKFNGLHNCVHAPVTEAARKRCLRKQEAWTIVAYDCETIVSAHGDYRGTESIGVKHVPNVLSFKIICNQCYGDFCVSCGEIQTFTYNLRKGESGTVLERFVHFLKTDSRTSNAYIIAHNGGRYDHVFVLEELIKNENYTPNFIMSGSTFISANVQISSKRTLHFLDSVKFLPMRLSQLPAAFDLATESKGHFPYMFNHPDNYGKVLSTLPPIEFYEPKYMGVKQRKEFEQWYEENRETEFNFDEEIVRYCKNDVQILSEALIKFIKSTTIASYIMFVLKQEHIKTPTVGFIPENGYPGRNNSSFALKFLLWTEHQNPGMTLKHKLRAGGEHVIRCKRQIYSVDGYDPETGHVYEIHGCMYHGCPRCYLNREQPSPHDKNRTMAELYDYTMLKDDDIRDSGFTLHVHWECDIREELRKNAEMKHFFKNVIFSLSFAKTIVLFQCNYTHQLRPREAMYGGRTQQFKSFVIADEEYTIEYYDYCSLYPFVNIRGAKYPIGTPLRLTDGHFDEIVPGQPLPYHGLAFCDILPPKNCPIPVLPVRVDSKLIFPLCRKCSTSKRKTPCKHTKVTDRYLTGVWCTDEINLAISEGYQLLKYHEVWHWPEESWFQGGFFEKFMSPLLKMKHESSGWPEEDMSEEKKQAHIKTIHDTDHVDLDPENVKKNPALRSLAKLFLNSTWGKFAQNPCKTETKLLPTSQGLKIAQFFDDQGYEPKCFKDWGENHVLVSRRPFKESLQTAPFTNIVYGALTTCGARIKLYEAMKRVGAENLIYCDTDSIIFRQRRGQDLLGDLIGEALGKMTREVPIGWTIAEIVAMAAKVYALKMVDENGQVKCVTKAKGITLNSETADAVNFETMKELVISIDASFIILPLFTDAQASRFSFRRIYCPEDAHEERR